MFTNIFNKEENIDGDKLISYDLIKGEHIYNQS